MKIENEIEKLMKRISLLENQNGKFKSLLDSALEVTKQSLSTHDIQKDETEFLRETINLIEDEKMRMQEDLEFLSAAENETVLYSVKTAENNILELQKKMELLIEQFQKQTKDIEQLKKEHAEFKFLLTQSNSNHQLLKNILQLDTSTCEIPKVTLQDERNKLQNKLVSLDKQKSELLTTMENLTKSPKKTASEIKSKLEKALFQTIDSVAQREYESLHAKVLDLEKERNKILSELQTVLDNSKKDIANEYCKLQKKILEIETQKAELQLTLRSMNNNTEAGEFEEENKKIENILDAFTNDPTKFKLKREKKGTNISQQLHRYQRYSPYNLYTCNIL